MLYHRWKVDFIAVILILATIASCTQLRADDYIVTINTEKAKTIQACVLGTPDNKFVRVCVNRRHYALRYNREWVLEPLFVDKDSVSYKCSCKSYDALKVTKAGQVVERDFYHIRKEYEMEQMNLKQGHIYIGEIKTPKKRTNKLVNSKNANKLVTKIPFRVQDFKQVKTQTELPKELKVFVKNDIVTDIQCVKCN